LLFLFSYAGKYSEIRVFHMAQPTQYIIMEPLGGMTDLDSIRMRLAEIGLAREAFSLDSDVGRLRLTFWEPDRIEALRILARLDHSNPC